MKLVAGNATAQRLIAGQHLLAPTWFVEMDPHSLDRLFSEHTFQASSGVGQRWIDYA